MRWLVGFAVLVFPACPLAGQAVLHGRVQADSTRQPIAGASLVISGFSSPVFSNALGRYACKRHMAMTMRQGHGGGQDDRMVCLPNISCPLAVYVDGALLGSPGMTELPPDIMPVMARELEAVEVYRGPSETPVEYQGTGSGCGVMMLWTRVSGSSLR